MMRDRLKNRKGETERALEALRRWRAAQEEMEGLRIDLRHCVTRREEAERSIPARPLDGMPRASGGRADPTLRAAEELVDHIMGRERRLLERMRKLMAEREATERAIGELGDAEQRIVRMRWMRRLNWVAVAIRLELSERQCQRIHIGALIRMSAALEKFDEEKREACRIMSDKRAHDAIIGEEGYYGEWEEGRAAP